MLFVLSVAGILLLLYLLLLCPLVITADINREPELFLKFLFIKIPIYPKRKKLKKHKKPKEKVAKPRQKKTKHYSISYYVDKYGEIVKALLGSAGKLLKHIRVNRLDVSLTVAEEDAAKTAVEYGAVCAVAYPIISALESNVEIKERNISIIPDFDAKTSSGVLYVDVRIKALHVLAALFGLLSQLIKFISK